MKLFVDDMRMPQDNSWTVARTNTEAIRLLAGGYGIEEISIDHDICVPNMGDISEPLRRRLQIGQETFMPVIYYIVAMKPEDRPKKITIHTANFPASIRMQGLLDDAGIESQYKESSCKFDLGDNEK